MFFTFQAPGGYGHGREGGPADLHDEPLSAMVLHTLRRDGFMFFRPRGDWARMLSKPFSLRTPQIAATGSGDVLSLSSQVMSSEDANRG